MTRLEVPGRDVIGVRAANPGPFSLSGTNSWILGREPAWLIDPGPALEPHLDALVTELDSRGGVGGIALTHDHVDHSEAVPKLLRRLPGVSVAAARGDVSILLGDGDRWGPAEVLALPGHAPDHLVFLCDDLAFTGDAVLGEGSVFVAPDPGALRGYLDGLARLRDRQPAVICPGHGPVVDDPRSKLDEYIAHRLDRERGLLHALAEGRRSVDELLDAVWSDAPATLRLAATVTLAAHLDKLAEEGKLPPDVERPSGWSGQAGV